jgi:cytochrome c oxidase subunit 3
MSVLFSPTGIEPPKSGQGRGGEHPPAFGGGGGEGSGDGSPDYESRLQRAKLGLILGVVSISMVFVTVTTVFFFLRQSTEDMQNRTSAVAHNWLPVNLPTRLLLFNTLVLVLSSFSIELARRDLDREMVLAPLRTIPGIAVESRRRIFWLLITVALGLIFLTGQWWAWETLRAHGFHLSTLGSSPFFYVLTGTHAVHLAGGILVLLYSAAISLLQLRPIEQRRILLEVAALYWHFMGVLWVYVFVLLMVGS